MADRSISDFAKNLERGSKTLQMYSETHPSAQRVIQETYKSIQELLKNRESITVSVYDGQLLVDGEIADKGNLLLNRLAKELAERNIQNLRILHGLKMEEMLWLLQHLNFWPHRIREMGGFEKMIQDSGIQTIQANLDLYAQDYSYPVGSDQQA